SFLKLFHTPRANEEARGPADLVPRERLERHVLLHRLLEPRKWIRHLHDHQTIPTSFNFFDITFHSPDRGRFPRRFRRPWLPRGRRRGGSREGIRQSHEIAEYAGPAGRIR